MRLKTFATLAAATLAIASITGIAAATAGSTTPEVVADTGWGSPGTNPTATPSTNPTPVTNGDTGWG